MNFAMKNIVNLFKMANFQKWVKKGTFGNLAMGRFFGQKYEKISQYLNYIEFHRVILGRSKFPKVV